MPYIIFLNLLHGILLYRWTKFISLVSLLSFLWLHFLSVVFTMGGIWVPAPRTEGITAWTKEKSLHIKLLLSKFWNPHPAGEQDPLRELQLPRDRGGSAAKVKGQLSGTWGATESTGEEGRASGQRGSVHGSWTVQAQAMLYAVRRPAFSRCCLSPVTYMEKEAGPFIHLWLPRSLSGHSGTMLTAL